MRPFSLVAFALTLGWSNVAASAPTVPVTTCGQLVTRGTIGYLTGDLDCTATPDAPAVSVDRHARLDFRGFTITGGRFGVWCGSDYDDVSADVGRCQIVGAGGTIEDANIYGIGGGGVVASNLTIRNSFYDGIFASTVKLSNSTITGNGGNGVGAYHDVKVVGSTVTGSGYVGLESLQRRVKVVDSTVIGNGTDPQCASLPCGDLSSPRHPSVKNTVCESSIKLTNPIGTWGVCALD